MKRCSYLYFYGLPVAAVKMTIEAAEPERIESTIYDSSMSAVFAFAAFLIIKLRYLQNVYVCVVILLKE